MAEKMKSFSMLLSDELKAKLRKKAQENGQSLSAYIRLVLSADVKK
ncbi:MAG: ribbon-helix-helix protein, CopG family [Liquorilactobacillus satsumensis]